MYADAEVAMAVVEANELSAATLAVIGTMDCEIETAPL